MKHFYPKFLMSIVMICLSFSASAYDIELDGIYYAIDSENDKTCIVVKGDGNDIEIPPTVSYDGQQYTVIGISGMAFYYCESIRSVSIPETVLWIGWGAFHSCSSLTSVKIPASVEDIGNSVFTFCKSLSDISVSPDNPNYCSVEGVLFNKDCTTLLAYPNAKSVEYIIPESVTEIRRGSFEGCVSLMFVTIPNSVTKIGEDAFNYCTSLISATIPNSVTEIGEYAFSGCRALTSVTIPDSLTEISKGAFYQCSSITTVKIPESVTSIGEAGFSGCSSISSIYIPSAVESLGNYAFGACYSLSEISVSVDNPNYCSVDGVLFNKDCSKLLVFPNRKCSEYIIPDFVKEIGYCAFSNCISLTSVIIPESLTIIGSQAFSDCISLISVSIPDSVTEIGYSSFGYCTSLSTVSLPGTISKIGEHSFYDCNNITSVYYNCEDPLEFNGYDMFTCQDNATLYVPESAVEKCKVISPWKDFTSIETFDFTGVEFVCREIVNTIIGRYDTSGALVDENYKGLVIVHFSDGSIKKVIQK